MRKLQNAFTLIELMITVAIVAILASISYPSYRNQVLRANRAEARTVLLQIQVAQEKFFLQFNRYAGDSTGAIDELRNAPTHNTMPGLGISATTPNGYYNFALTRPTTTTYTATATAMGAQLDDADCKKFNITSTGLKTAEKMNTSANNTVCWR